MDQALFKLGTTLVFVGFVIIFIAILLLILRTMKDGGRIRGGGMVIIGPFPIIFGTDKESVKVLLLLSIALIGLWIVFMIFLTFK